MRGSNGSRGALTLGLVLGLATPMVGAEETQMVTGKENLVCASQNVMACADGPVCMQGNISTFKLPAFMFVDFKKKNIRAVDLDGSDLTSAVKTYDVTEQSVIMQGYENHRGWTVAVDRTDASFTASSTGPDVNFMVMGACTTL